MAYSGAFHMRRPEEEEETPQREDTARDRERGKETASREPVRPNGRKPPFDLGALFAKTEAVGMETDDLLMALILYLMYRESGDTDLLIMLGVMLLT